MRFHHTLGHSPHRRGSPATFFPEPKSLGAWVLVWGRSFRRSVLPAVHLRRAKKRGDTAGHVPKPLFLAVRAVGWFSLVVVACEQVIARRQQQYDVPWRRLLIPYGGALKSRSIFTEAEDRWILNMTTLLGQFSPSVLFPQPGPAAGTSLGLILFWTGVATLQKWVTSCASP